MNKMMAALASLGLVMGMAAQAAEISVISGGAIEPGLKAAAAAFEKQSGHKVNITFNTTPQMTKRVAAGDTFDVIIAPPAAIKQFAAAGKVAFATNGEGAFLHMATELFRSQVGFEYLHVPFKGVPQMGQELMAGRVDAAFSSFTGMYPFVMSGKVRLLGIAKETRAANYPDLPTIAESVPGFSSGGWFGFVAPAKVPKEIITILNREANAALKQPEVRTKLEALGLEVWTESPEYLGDLIKSEYDKYGKVARDIKLVPK